MIKFYQQLSWRRQSLFNTLINVIGIKDFYLSLCTWVTPSSVQPPHKITRLHGDCIHIYIHDTNILMKAAHGTLCVYCSHLLVDNSACNIMAYVWESICHWLFCRHIQTLCSWWWTTCIGALDPKQCHSALSPCLFVPLTVSVTLNAVLHLRGYHAVIPWVYWQTSQISLSVKLFGLLRYLVSILDDSQAKGPIHADYF